MAQAELTEEKESKVYDYHRDFSKISNSMLRKFLPKKPNDGDTEYEKRLYESIYVTRTKIPDPPTKEMQEGSALHEACLEERPLSEVVKVYPETCLNKKGHLNPKPCEAFRKENSDFEYFAKQKDFDRLAKAVDVFRSSVTYQLIQSFDAVVEKPFFWKCQHSGLECRMKSDFVVPDHSKKKLYVFDLKTTSYVRPEEFQRHLGNMKWWSQSCHYGAGLAAQEEYQGYTIMFSWVALEPDTPNRISWSALHADSQTDAHGKYVSAMLELAKCYETGNWSESWEGQLSVMSLKPWQY